MARNSLRICDSGATTTALTSSLDKILLLSLRQLVIKTGTLWRTDHNCTRSLITCPPHSPVSLIVIQGTFLRTGADLFHSFNFQNKSSPPCTNPLSKERGCRPEFACNLSSLLQRLQKVIRCGIFSRNTRTRRKPF